MSMTSVTRTWRALTRLLELSDNDLMDLLLARKEPEGELADAGCDPRAGMLRSA